MSEWNALQPGTTITINGKTYHSLEEMAPEDRVAYDQMMERVIADRDGNGVPDIIEGKSGPNEHVTSVVMTAPMRFVIQGREYTRWEDVPEEARMALEAAGAGPDQWAKNLAGRPSLPLSAVKLAQSLNIRELPASMQEPGGITIRLSWGTIIALAAGLVAAAVWIARSSGRH